MFVKLMNAMEKMTRKDTLYLERRMMPSRLENEVFSHLERKGGISGELMHSFCAVSQKRTLLKGYFSRWLSLGHNIM